MQRLKTYLLLIALLIIPFACSEPIDLRTGVTGGQLVIFGRITNGTFGNFVNVARTSHGGEAPEPVSGAIVRILNDKDNYISLTEDDRNPGNYEFPHGIVFGEVGVSYILEVNIDNKFYTTSLQEMPANYGRENMSWEWRQVEDISDAGVAFTEDVITVSSQTEFDELPDEFYLRWDIEEAYTYLGTFLPPVNFPRTSGQVQCYVINDLNEQRIFLHNGKENRATSIPDRVFVNRRLDKSFQTLHYFNLIRSSVNKETYDYWSKMNFIANRQGSIFDVPPAPLPGNILSTDGEEVLGFFEVVHADTTRMPVTRRDIPVFIFDECEKKGADFLELLTVPRDCVQCLIDRGIVDPSCLFCGILPNSTYIRPSYF